MATKKQQKDKAAGGVSRAKTRIDDSGARVNISDGSLAAASTASQERAARTYTPPSTGGGSSGGLSVTSYKDNPDGTTTNTLSDGSKDTGTYSQKGDGTLNFNPLGSAQNKTGAATPSPYYPRYSKQPQKLTQPESSEQIQRRLYRDAQSEINSLRTYEKNLLKEQATINEKDARSTQARSVLSGLSGSSEADFAQQETAEKGRQANEKIRSAVEVQVQGILSEVRKNALEEARFQRQEARLDESAQIENQAKRMALANEAIKNLAASGVTFEGLKNDPQTFEYLARQYGGVDALKGAFVLNTPQEDILDKQIKGGSYVIAKRNKLTGKITIETADLGLPPTYTDTIDAGDRILAVPENWDGDPSKLVSIAKGLTPAQSSSGGGGAAGENPQLYAGLSSATATAVRAKVNAFKSEPVVQNFATIQEGRNFAGSLSDDTKNPADDQALIYSLAKALDPGSVVREGEYATAQKYAQSWIAAYGTGVQQAINGTGFLSKQARRNIKDTIESRYKASKSSYDNISNQYKSGINSLTGRSDGNSFLVDYATPEPAGQVVTAPDGQEVEIID